MSARRMLAALGCLMLLLTGCGVGTTAAPATVTDTSRLVIAAAPFAKQTWEPWLGAQGESVVLHTIGEKLIFADKTGALVPGLAESWSVSPDIKTWTFKLRAGVPFHDGYGDVTAEDVKFSWEQFIQKDSTQNAAGLLRQAVDGDMKNFTVTGPLEFKVTTTKPVVVLAAALSQTVPDTMNIQSKKYWDTNAAKAKVHPVGTGPYKFISSTQGVEAVVEALPTHWKKAATFKTVVFKIIEDEAARLAQVQSGSVDLAFLPPKLVAEAKAAGLNLFGIKDTGNINLFFGGLYPGHANYDRTSPWIQADSPEKGTAIRQAMSLAIDRKLILEKLLLGYGTLTTAPIVQFPSNPKLVDPAWSAPYDVAKAKQMLAQGGYPNGFDVIVPVFPWQTTTSTVEIAESVAGMYEAIGLKVKRLPMDYSTWREKTIARSTNGWVTVQLVSFYTETVQALTGTLLPSSGTARMYDPAITAAVDKLNVEPDAEKRIAIAKDMMATLLREMKAVPLFTIDAAVAASKKVGTWEPIPGAAHITNVAGILPPK